jgi:hypothetical protein
MTGDDGWQTGSQELGFGPADGSPCLHGAIEAGTGVLQLPRAPCLAQRPGPPSAELLTPVHGRPRLLVGTGL